MEMMFGFGDKFIYFECSECGCLQLSDKHFDLSKYYPQEYYSYEEIPERKSSENVLDRNLKRVFWKRKAQNELFGGTLSDSLLYRVFCRILGGALGLDNYSSISRVPLTLDSKILDVGCGSGRLLYVLRNLGFKNLLGCDPYITENFTYENGLQILKESLQNIRGKWDLIMFHSSFEHIPDEFETLQSVHDLLRPKGICIIRVPITSSYAWKHYGTNWVQIDAPRHFYLHSVKSLKILAGKANLNLKKINYDSTDFQFWGSERYVRGIPLYPLKTIFSKKQVAEFKRKARDLNKTRQGDEAVFYFSRT
jgi:2-polyprenyl-3-methyl-5-hydroxy-6-metoxy-1,4-benzoquinol methylase